LLALTSISDIEFSKKLNDIFTLKYQERIKLIGVIENNDIEKKIFLQIIDFTWRSHLQYLEQLRQVIGLRSYGQKDPLSEFKKESFILFEGLLEKIKTDVVKFLLNLNIVVSQEKKIENKTQSKIPENCLLKLMKNQKIQRNEKCEATGKKFKNCCGASL
jgi:preprotein translocase subunit SecA